MPCSGIGGVRGVTASLFLVASVAGRQDHLQQTALRLEEDSLQATEDVC